MDYGSQKRSLRELLDDMIRHPFKTGLTLLASFLMFVGVIAVGTFVSNWVSGKVSPAVAEGYRPPELKLTYSTTLKSQMEEGPEKGLYKTFYSVSVQQPPGNFETGFPIVINVPNAECTKPQELGSEQWTMGSIGSSTYVYVVECLSNTPIVDTGKLFFLRKQQ